MSQIRTRHHDETGRRRPPVAGSRERARRTLDAGAAARTLPPPAQPARTAGPAGTGAPTGPAATPADVRPDEGRRPRILGRTATSGGRRRGGRRTITGWPLAAALVLGLLLVALAATAGLMAQRSRHLGAAETARDQALAAARTEASAFLSYDYRRLDQDFAAAKAGLTGRFAGEYAATSDQVVRPTATQYKAVVKADVVALSVADASPDQVVVLAFVDQTTTSTRLAGPRVDANRVRMTLVPVHGRWKVSAVDAL